MAKQDWEISGRLRLDPQLGDVEAAFGSPVDLRGVRVRVSAKEVDWDPTGWQTWGEDVTDSEGRFSIRKSKDRSKRYFRVEVQFKDDRLKIYGDDPGTKARFLDVVKSVIPGPIDDWTIDLSQDAVSSLIEQTSRIAYQVDWLEVHKTPDKKDGPRVELPPLVFAAGKPLALGSLDRRCHAEIWYLVREYIDFVDAQGTGFRTDRPIAVKYPHENAWIGDRSETAYANMHNDTVYLIRNGHRDNFDVQTILHEVEHLHCYQHTKGEDALFGALVTGGSTHTGRLRKPYIGWYEAWAEVVSNEVYRQLFDTQATIYSWTVGGSPWLAERRPFSRPYLRSQGIDSLAEMEHYELGWMSALALLLCPDATALDMDVPGPYAEDPTPGTRLTATGLTLGELFAVLEHFHEGGDDGGLHRRRIDLHSFIHYAADMYDHFTHEAADAYLAILDPAEARSPAELLGSRVRPQLSGSVANPVGPQLSTQVGSLRP